MEKRGSVEGRAPISAHSTVKGVRYIYSFFFFCVMGSPANHLGAVKRRGIYLFIVEVLISNDRDIYVSLTVATASLCISHKLFTFISINPSIPTYYI